MHSGNDAPGESRVLIFWGRRKFLHILWRTVYFFPFSTHFYKKLTSFALIDFANLFTESHPWSKMKW